MRLSVMTAVAVLMSLLLPGAAWAAPKANTMDIHVVVAADGAIAVTAKAQVVEANSVVWEIPRSRAIDNARYYQYTITDITGGQAQVESTAVRVTSDVVSGVAQLSYRVTGATHTVSGQDQPLTIMQWPALNGFNLPVESLKVTVDGPGVVQFLDCSAGPVGAIGQCAAKSGGTYNSPAPSFSDGPRAAGDEVVVTVGYASAELAATSRIGERWSLNKAFELSWPALLVALATAAVGVAGLYLLHRRIGRDLDYDGEVSPIATFTPSGDGEVTFEVHAAVRPGHVGTVVDERVDPIDITATLLDLAVRGHLRIIELPASLHGLKDWRLERADGADDLVRFEQTLLDAVTPEGKSSLVSQLPQTISQCIADVQDALYDDVVVRGWFETRPDATRSWWRWRSYAMFVLAVVVATALVWLTHFGLAALVILGLGAASVKVAEQMPRRTAAGTALLRGLSALAATLATQPTQQIAKGHELAEISKVLGYTVVLGSKERWLNALVAADEDDLPDPTALSWYHAPETWHLRDLPASLTQFIHTVQGELFNR